MRVWFEIMLAGLLFWLAACGATNLPPPRVAQTPTPPAPPASVAATPASPTRSALPTLAASTDASKPLELTIWVPEDFATGAERGGDVLEKQIADFHTAHPNISITYVLKAPYGKGGMVDWLMQLNELMPDRLPDAAIVDSRELDRIEKLGLLHPLNRALPSGMFWDLFPPAQKMARLHGQWDNQPLTLETEHLVYDTRRIATPPVTWQDVLTSTAQFAFAADSTEAFLFQYLENGGSLDPYAHPVSDTSAMQVVLDYYQRARANGNLNENTAMLKSAREVMPLFLTGQTPMAQVRARDFLIERARLPNALAAPIPTRDGRATALVSGWSFIIVTDDAARQNASAAYLAWLIDPARLAAWTRAADMLPAGKSAFAQALTTPQYAEILWALLQDALVAPSFSQQTAYANAWHSAVQAVFSGQLSPDDAAFRAAQAITQ